MKSCLWPLDPPHPLDTLEETGQRGTQQGGLRCHQNSVLTCLGPEGWALGRSCSYPPQGTEQKQGWHGGSGMVPFPGSSDRLLPTVYLLVLSPLIGHLVRVKSQLRVFLVGDLSNESCKAQGGRVLGLSGHLDRSLPSQKAPPCHCPQD